jgi:hypothetical protein
MDIEEDGMAFFKQVYRLSPPQASETCDADWFLRAWYVWVETTSTEKYTIADMKQVMQYITTVILPSDRLFNVFTIQSISLTEYKSVYDHSYRCFIATTLQID